MQPIDGVLKFIRLLTELPLDSGAWAAPLSQPSQPRSEDRVIKPFPRHFCLLFGICTVLALPLIGIVAIRVHEAQREIAHLEREKLGLGATLVADDLLVGIERFRIAQFNRTAPAEAERLRAGATVLSAFRTLRSPANHGISDAGPRTNIAGLEEQWTALQALQSPRERARTSMALGDAILELLLDIGDASELTYDPTVDSINLSDAIAARLPSQSERRDQSAEVIALAGRHGHISALEIIEAETLMGEAHDALLVAIDDCDGATQAIPELEPALRENRVGLEHSAARLSAAVEAVILETTASRARTMQTLRLDSATASVLLARVSAANLARSFDTRIGAYERTIRTTILVGAGVGALSFLAIAALGRAMRRRDQLALAHANERAQALETKLARRNAERALRMTEQQFRAVFDGSLVGIAIIERAGRRIDPNGAFHTMFDGDFTVIIVVAMQMFATLDSEKGTAQRAEHRFDIPGRPALWAEVSLSLIRGDDDDALSAILMVHDITEHKTLHERLDYQNLHDALTALPNRVFFMRRLEALVAAQSEPFAVVFLDLDRFKSVNDTLGHHAGDRLLRLAARRLSECVRACDFVARLHGDEFAVLLADLPSDGVSEVAEIVERLERSLRIPVETPTSTIVVSASLGIVRSSAEHRNAEQYLREADAAMYQSKLGGRGCATLYDAATCAPALLP